MTVRWNVDSSRRLLLLRRVVAAIIRRLRIGRFELNCSEMTLVALSNMTLFWLIAPAVGMLLVTLVHTLRHWNRPQ